MAQSNVVATFSALLLVCLLTPLAGCEKTQTTANTAAAPPLPADMIIRNVRLFDGVSVTENTSVTIHNGRVQHIGEPLTDTKVTIDGRGKTLLPGLIDAHVHAFDDNSLRDALRFGVTTQFDMFTDYNFAASQRTRRGSYDKTDLSDLFSAGTMVTTEGGHGTQFGLPIPTISAPEDADAFIRARLTEGSDYIKIVYEPNNSMFASISKETLEALITAAHAQNAMAVVHASSQESARDAVMAGADGLVHIFADSEIENDLIAEMLQQDVFVIPTLSVIAAAARQGLGPKLLKDTQLAPYISYTQMGNLGLDFGDSEGITELFNLDHALTNTYRLHQAGVRILAGTDAPNPGTSYGISMHGELALLVRAGLSPQEALMAATRINAQAFNLPERGTVTPGDRADLVLVIGNPLEDILASRAIHRTYKNGHRVKRKKQETAAPVENPTLTDGLISQFDEGPMSAFNVPWVTTTDQLANGQSTAEITHVSGDAGDRKGVLRIDGVISTKFPFPWSGAGVFFSQDFTAAYDLSGYSTIKFDIRGNARDLSLMFFTRTSRQRPATVTFSVKDEWQQISLPLDKIRGAATNEVFGFAITAGRPEGAFSFEIDNVQLEEKD